IVGIFVNPTRPVLPRTMKIDANPVSSLRLRRTLYRLSEWRKVSAIGTLSAAVAAGGEPTDGLVAMVGNRAVCDWRQSALCAASHLSMLCACVGGRARHRTLLLTCRQ